MKVARCLFVLAILQGIANFTWAADSATSEVEDQLKATYLYKFIAYIQWPPSVSAQAGAPLIIGVIGADGVAGDLRTLLSDHPISSHSVEVKVIDICIDKAWVNNAANEPLTLHAATQNNKFLLLKI